MLTYRVIGFPMFGTAIPELYKGKKFEDALEACQQAVKTNRYKNCWILLNGRTLPTVNVTKEQIYFSETTLQN